MNNQFEYKRAMDSIHVTEEWEDNMIEKLMNAQESGEPAARIRRMPRLGLVAAAAVACLTVGAGAAEAATGVVSDIFAPLLGTAHTEIIDSIGYPVGVSDSSGGVTVTADAIIGDSNSVCVIYSLKKDDGSTWDEVPDSTCLLFEDSTFDFQVANANPSGWGSHGGSWFIDEDPADDTIQYVEQRTVDDGTAHGAAKETLKNLCVWDDEAQKPKVIVKGKWALRFTIDFEDTTRTYPTGQEVEFLGEPATITGLTISPISFRVELEQARTEYPLTNDYKYLDGKSEALDALSITLKLTDGRELDLGYWSGGSAEILHEEGAARFSKSDMFDEIFTEDELESIIVCGTEIPLR